MCIYTHVIHDMETLVGKIKWNKIGTAINAACHSSVSLGLHSLCYTFQEMFLVVNLGYGFGEVFWGQKG